MTNQFLSRSSSIALFAVGSAASVAAFVIAPAALLRRSYPQFQDQTNMTDQLGRSLVDYVNNGVREFPSVLAQLIEYWYEWHAIKIIISMALIVTFGLLAASLWRRSLTAGIGCTVAATTATVLGLFSVVVAILNTQSTVAPIVALLPMLDSGGADTDRARTSIANVIANQNNPAVAMLLEQVKHYNWSMIASTAAVIAIACAAGYVAFRRYAAVKATDRSRSHMFLILGILAVTMAVSMILMLILAVSAVIDPEEALRGAIGQ